MWTASPFGCSLGEGCVCVSALCSLQLDVVLFTSVLSKLAVVPQIHPQRLSLMRVAETEGKERL